MLRDFLSSIGVEWPESPKPTVAPGDEESSSSSEEMGEQEESESESDVEDPVVNPHDEKKGGEGLYVMITHS